MQARTETTLKTANVTQQSAAEVSDLLTAVWNGYKVSAEEAELYVDKLAAVAATTASDLEELSTGMSRVASAANMMGVDVDQLNAQLSTIISVTRQAPESVGTALRSIYARMGQLKSDGEDDFGVTLGQYTKQMKQMGIEILDEQNNMRDMGSVIEDVAAKWGDWTQAQKIAAAQAMAGTRQYNNLVALFDNWDMYTAALETSSNAMGTLQEQEDIYLESTQAHIQQMKTSFEGLYDSLLDTDDLNNVYDLLGKIASALEVFVDSIGGGGNALLGLGSIAANVFSKQIASGINTTITNFQNAKYNAEQLAGEIEALGRIQNSKAMEDPAIAAMVNSKEQLQKSYSLLSPEQINQGNALVQQLGQAKDLELQWKANTQAAVEYTNKLMQAYQEEDLIVEKIDDLDFTKGTETTEKMQMALEGAARDADILEQKVKDFDKARKRYDPEVETRDWANVWESFEPLIAQVELFKDRTDLSEESLKRLKEAFESLNINNVFDYISEGFDETKADATEAEQNIYAIRKAVIEAVKEIRASVGNVNSVVEGEFEGAKAKSEELEENTKRATTEMDRFNKQSQQLGTIQTFTKLASAIGQVSFALTSIISLYDTWTNKELSFSEKIIRTFTTLGTVIPSVLMALSTFKVALTDIAIKFGLITAEGATATGAIVAFANAIKSAFPILLAITGAIVGITIAIKAGIKAYNADADAAKEAAEAAKELKTAYDDLKQSYDDLKQSLSDYQSAKDGLDELIKGTDEWNSAIQSLNEQVIELLEKYPELAEYINNEDGLLSISEEGQKTLLQKQSDKVQAAYRTSLLANISSDEAANKSTVTDFVRETNRNSYFNGGAAVLSNESVNKVLDAIDKNGTAILKNSDTLMEAADITRFEADALLNSGENAAQKIEDLSTKVQANIESNEIYAQQIGQSLLEGTQYAGSNFASQISQLVGQNVRDLNVQYARNYEDKLGGKLDSTIQRQYAEMMGYEASKDKTGNVGSYLIDGEWKDIPDSVARAALAMRDAQETATDNINKYAAAINEMTNVTTTIGNALGSENVQNALANLALKNSDLSDLSKRDIRQLSNMNLNDVSSSTLETLGFKDTEELRKFRNNAISDWYSNIDNITKDMLEPVFEAFSHIDKDNLSLGQMQEIGDVFRLANDYGKLNEAIAAYKEGSLEEFANELNFTEESLASFQEEYANIHKIIDGIKSGDTIDKDEFDALGEESQQYFAEMLDGTYKLIGSAEEFKKTTQEGLIQKAVNQRDALSEQNQRLTNLSKYDFEHFSQNAGYQEEGKNFFDPVMVQKQIDIIKELGDQSGVTEDQIRSWQKQLEEGSFKDVNSLQEITDAVASCGDAFENLGRDIQNNKNAIEQWDISIALSYDNMRDLEQAYSDSIVQSAEAFNTAAYAIDQAEDTKNLDPEELEDYADYLQDAAEEMEGFNKEMSDNEAKDVAKGIMKMNDAIDTLADNWKDWSDIIKKSSKSSEEFADAMTNARKTVADLLDVNKDFVSSDFISDNLDLIKQAATGSADAIDELKSKLADDIFAQIILDNSQFIADTDAAQAAYDNLKANIPDIKVGATLENGSFIAALNELIQDTGMTVNQVNALCDALGFEAKYKNENVKTTYQVPVTTTQHTRTITQTDPETGNPTEWTESEQVVDSHLEPYYGEYTAFAIATDGKSPTVTGITKKASGSANNYSSSNKGGKAPGKNKKSGGGGKGSTKKKQKVDKIQDKPDRYHDINLEIKDLENNFDKLEDQQEKLFGKDLIDNLQKELDILEKQKKAYQDKIKLAQGEANEIKKQLKSQGVKFDSDGYIANYSKALQAQLKKRNKTIAWYNKLSAAEQEKEKNKKKVENAKEKYEEFKEQIETYDELISDTIPGLKETIQDTIDKEVENQIKMFTMSVQLRLDMSEAERDFNEFQKKVVNKIKDDDILGNARYNLKDLESYYNTYGTGTGSIQSLTNQINGTIEQIKQINKTGTSSVYGNDKAAAIEDLQEYYEELMDQLEDTEDIVEEIKESYLDMIDEAVDAFDEQVDQYEYINDLLDHDMNLIGLMYGDDAYAEMSNYYQQIEQNNNQELDFLRQRVAYAQQMMDAEKDNPEARKKWEEEWENSLSELNDKVEDSVQNLIDKYSNAINLAFDKLNDKITNGKGLDYVSDEWDLINKNADQYLDTVNSLYGIKDLENKYLEALDQTDSLSAQRKLNDMMTEQLDMLRSKDKLTQYDVDRANKLYEITLKQIALEEAQQNKSKMRLRRDSQGNYSYQFVSDDNEIAQAQQDLLAAQNDLYNFDKEKYKENLDDIYEYYTEFQDKYIEIMTDMSLTDEERQERAKLLEEQYGDLINGIVEQNENIRVNLYESAYGALKGLYEADKESFKQITGENYDNFKAFVEQSSSDFKDFLLGASSDFQSLTNSNIDAFSKMTKEEFESFKKLVEQNSEIFSNMTAEEYEAFKKMVTENSGIFRSMSKGDFEAFQKLAGDSAGAFKDMTWEEFQAFKQLVYDNSSVLNKMTGEDFEAFKKIVTDSTGVFNEETDKKYEAFQELIEKSKRGFNSLADVDKLVMDKLVPQWDSGIQAMIHKFSGEGGFIPTCKDAFGELDQATKDYQKSLKNLEQLAGISFEDIASGYDRNIESVKELVKGNSELINKYKEEVQSVKSVIDQMDILIEKYKSARQAAVAAVDAAYKLQQEEDKKTTDTGGKSDSGGATLGTTGSTPLTGGPTNPLTSGAAKEPTRQLRVSSDGDDTTQGDGKVQVGDKVTFKSGKYYSNSAGATPTGTKKLGKKVYVIGHEQGADYPWAIGTKKINIKTSKSSDGWLGWVKKKQLSEFDTGGYTGEWGSEGRLGILHQKELVLKPEDTENILNAVSIVRSIDSLANELNSSMYNRIAGMMFNLNSSITTPMRERESLKQDVRITAEFPNVHDAREIENALNNLVNVAGQHAFNNRR